MLSSGGNQIDCQSATCCNGIAAPGRLGHCLAFVVVVVVAAGVWELIKITAMQSGQKQTQLKRGIRHWMCLCVDVALRLPV